MKVVCEDIQFDDCFPFCPQEPVNVPSFKPPSFPHPQVNKPIQSQPPFSEFQPPSSPFPTCFPFCPPQMPFVPFSSTTIPTTTTTSIQTEYLTAQTELAMNFGESQVTPDEPKNTPVRVFLKNRHGKKLSSRCQVSKENGCVYLNSTVRMAFSGLKVKMNT